MNTNKTLSKVDLLIAFLEDRKDSIFEEVNDLIIKNVVLNNIPILSIDVSILIEELYQILLQLLRKRDDDFNNVFEDVDYEDFFLLSNKFNIITEENYFLLLKLQYRLLRFFKQIFLVMGKEVDEKNNSKDYYNFILNFFEQYEFKLSIKFLNTSQYYIYKNFQEKYKQKLNRTEQKYTNLLNSLDEAFYIIDEKFNFLEYNDIACNRLGYTRKEFSELSMDKLISQEDLPFLIRQYNILKDKGKYIYEIIHRTKMGHKIPVKINASLINYDGIPAYLIISKNTEIYKITEKKIKRARSGYRDLYENAPNAYLTINRNNLIKRCNKGAEEILGFYKYQLVNYNFLKLFADTENGLKKVKKFIEKIKKNQVLDNKEIQMKKINGDVIWTSLSANPRFDKDGNFMESRWAILNIDKRKKIEQKLKESEIKFREAYERANLFKDLIIHDISNILQIIQLSSELYYNPQIGAYKSESIEGLLDIINNAVEKGVKLVNNARILSQIDNSPFYVKSVDLLEMIRDSTKLFKKKFQEQELKIKINSFSDNIYVRANELLNVVFDNIFNNSSKYNANSIIEIIVNITITDLDGKSYIKLEFIDNGIGIPDFRKESIFIRGTKEKSGKGMGIGLSIVKKIVENYEGKIWVENRDENDHLKGSNFILLLLESTKN